VRRPSAVQACCFGTSLAYEVTTQVHELRIAHMEAKSPPFLRPPKVVNLHNNL
jgi:hypothetical protein